MGLFLLITALKFFIWSSVSIWNIGVLQTEQETALQAYKTRKQTGLQNT